jgi:Mg2+-importing ATPase
VRIGASSNFGNIVSVLGASVFVPYLPMLPIQILTSNLLYDVSQTAIPTDDVDPEQIEKPRPWDMARLTRFILFIGPCSSLFDYTTYLMMLFVFGCWDIGTPEAVRRGESLFQTGWFVESLLTQSLIISIIRTDRIQFLQSRPSWPLLVVTTLVMATGVALPSTAVGASLGFTPLPPLCWPLLALTIACYVALTQGVKVWLLRRGWI